MVLFALFLSVFTNVGGLTFRTLHTVENLNSYLYYATPLLQTLAALDAHVPNKTSFPISITKKEIDIAHIKNTELEEQISTMFEALKALEHTK